MKILQVNIFFDEGSTGKIVADIHKRLLRDGHESFVAFGRGRHQAKEDSGHLYRTTSNSKSLLYRRISQITGLRYNTAYLETYQFLRYLSRIKPDIVHLHCMNCAYIQPFILLEFLGKHNYKVLVTHHADVTITANCDHAFECEKWKSGCGHCPTIRTERRSFFIDGTHHSWRQMQKAFALVKNLYASGVSNWMTERVCQSPFFQGVECRTIFNGLDTMAFTYRGECDDIRQELGIKPNDKIVLHVTPNFSAPIKGGHYVIELAQKMPDIKFIIVGIKDFEKVDLPTNIIPINNVASKELLSKYYSIADMTLLLSFRESFSMVTAESLCCGTPVVGFKAGAPETITIPEYSEFVEYDDIDKLQDSVLKFSNKNFDKGKISNMACKRYSAEKMYQAYLTYYCDILS